MTPTLRAVYDELVERAARPPHTERSQHLRDAFLERCGRPDPGHPTAGARDAAAWEDALVRGGLAQSLAPDLDDAAERETARAFGRAQRGIFVFREVERTLIARDLWSAAELLVDARDDVGREMATAERRADSPLCEARLLATPAGCAVLPGTLFHPLDARPEVERVLLAAHERGLPTDTAMDALLKMEHTWHTLSRVKVGYAYRAELLPAPEADQ